MAFITKLNIQGIRSFGQDGVGENIEFNRKLTLITGPNGSGKSAVIDGLQYVTTGLTQKHEKLKRMIHDPRLDNKTKVKAEVKLWFKNISEAGEVEVMSRCHQLGTKKDGNKSGLTLTTLPGNIIDLGVSMSFLLNVIFCHQEDSNWPLDVHGKELKKKYDEIFGLTEQTEALEKKNKLRLDKEKQVKKYEKDAEPLKLKKENAEKLQDDLQKTEKQLSDAEEQVNNTKLELVPKEEEIAAINTKLQEIHDCNARKELHQGKKTEIEKHCKRLKDDLKEELPTDPEEDFEMKRCKLQEQMKEKQDALEEAEKQLTNMKESEGKQNDEYKSLLKDLGKYEEQQEQRQEALRMKKKTIQQAAKELNIAGISESAFSENETCNMSSSGPSLTSDESVSFVESKDEGQLDEVSLRKLSSDIGSEYEALGTYLLIKKAQIDGLKEEYRNLADRIFNMLILWKRQTRKPKVEDLACALGRCGRADLEAQITGDADEGGNLQVEDQNIINAIDNKIKELQKEEQCKSVDEAQGSTSCIDKFKEEIQELQAKRKEKYATMDKLIEEMSTLSTTMQSQTRMMQPEKAKEEAFINMEELQKLQQELESNKCTLSYNKFESEKERTDMFKDNIGILERQDATCPMCDRGFDEQSDLKGLVQKDKNELQEKNVTLVQQWEQRDAYLKGAKDLVSRLVNDVQEKMKEQKKNTAKMESSASAQQNEARSAIKMELDDSQEELQEGSDSHMQPAGRDGNRTIQDVITDMKTLKDDLVSDSCELEEKLQQFDKQTERGQNNMIALQIDKLENQQLELTGKIKIIELKAKKKNIEDLTIDIRRLGGNSNDLKTCLKNIATAEEKLNEMKKDQDNLTDNINETKNELNKNQNYDRQLKQLVDAQKDQQKEDDLIASEEKQLGQLLANDTDSDLKDKREKLIEDQTELNKTIHETGGQQDTLNQLLTKRQADLNSELEDVQFYEKLENKRKNAETTHEELQRECKKLVNETFRVLKEKLKEINEIIRLLWPKLYKRKDIDYIEICSDEDTGDSLMRRIYNCRVVMFKGDVSMDMPGRCSAGQKVLASLVIRMAIAEALCSKSKFDMLALDEPTANLDSENKKILADALVNILESRKDQENYRLIVVTHDMEFIKLLGQSSDQGYYEITKNEKSKSVVKTKCVSNRRKFDSDHNSEEGAAKMARLDSGVSTQNSEDLAY